MFEYLTKERSPDTRYHVFFKWATLNAVALFLLATAAFQGLLREIYEGDSTRIVLAIAGIGLYAILSSGLVAWRISNEFRVTKNQLRYLDLLSSTSVMLGLLGTVVGIIVALQAVDADAVGNVEAAGRLITGLANGMGIALYTTLVGGVCALWIGFNRFLLSRGVDKLIGIRGC
jgi:hypothetical protein